MNWKKKNEPELSAVGQFQTAQIKMESWKQGVRTEKLLEEILAAYFPDLWRTVSTQIHNPKPEQYEENYQAHHDCSESEINREA